MLTIILYYPGNCLAVQAHCKKTPDNLLKAYSDHITGVAGNNIIWKDGTIMPFDDGKRKKSIDALLNFPDLEDQLSMDYPEGKLDTAPPLNSDPGRVRYEPFFLKMYGHSSNEVKARLTAVTWLKGTDNKRILVTSVNGVDKKLQAISNELDALPEKIKKYAENISGTFNWRTISGSKRLSPHSFGIAIDINVNYSNYWKWDEPMPFGKIKYKNRIPLEIVDIFEKHGFIWGGKWYHYDTMHFEYRPELLHK